MRLILASSSPRRRALLASLGLTFEIIKPEIDETQHPGEDPYVFVQRLSREKAAAVAARIETPAAILAADTIVLAADTVGVDATGDILGKPVDADDARAMLRRLRGREHIVCTAFTLHRLTSHDDAQIITEAVKTRVTMRGYTDAEIDAYIASGDPFDKAGSYAIQNKAFAPVAHIAGDYNNVVGLPLDAVRAALVRLDQIV
jgi:septum formation protein